VLASVPASSGFPMPFAPWQQRLPAPEDPTWFDRLGLDKTAS
jgi:hypothetical protein